ncbi:MAG: YfhO family protein, partial [Bifidobacteriaceae bacterium]|nr:YfhO family protein [Bifidobacteriaceae bacterium]
VQYSSHLGLVFASVSDYMTQHVTLLDSFRQNFWNWQKPIPEFVPNLGGGQNAFNYTYHGLFNPLFIPFYFLPFINAYSYLIICNTLILLVSLFLTYFWLKRRFSTSITTLGTIAAIFATPLFSQMHGNFMFTSYLPFLLLALISVDKITQSAKNIITKNAINKNSLKINKSFLKNSLKNCLPFINLSLIISVTLIGLVSFYFLPACLIIIIIYTIYNLTEKNAYLKKRANKAPLKITSKAVAKIVFKIIFNIILGIALTAFILLPTFYAILQNSQNRQMQFNLTRALTPDFLLYNLPQINNLFSFVNANNSFISFSFISLLIILLNVFTKKRSNIFLLFSFIILITLPIFRLTFNLGANYQTKSLIPLLPIFALLIACTFKWLSGKIPNLAYSFLAIITILSIICPTLISNIPITNSAAGNSVISNSAISDFSLSNSSIKYMSQEKTNLNNTMLENVEKYLNSDNSVFRSAIDQNAAQNNKTSATYDLTDFSSNVNPKLYRDSIYLSTNNPLWQKYHNKTLWSNINNIAPWVVQNTNSVFANTLLGVKYIFNENSVNINKNAFSLGYASNNLFSNIDTYNDIEQKAILTQGIALDSQQANNYQKSQNPQIDNFKQIDLSNLFNKFPKQNNSYNIEQNQSFEYKLPEKIYNKLLFIKISLNEDTIKQFMSKSDNFAEIHKEIAINGIKNSFWINSSYQTPNYEFFYTLSPNDISQNNSSTEIGAKEQNNLETLKIDISKWQWAIKSIEAFTMPISDLSNAAKNFDQMNVKTFNSQGLTGDINITHPNSVLTFSIGYDSGFSLKVDNEYKPIFQTNGGTIGANIEQGNHKIELLYQAPFYICGTIISLITLILIIGSVIIKKQVYNKI